MVKKEQLETKRIPVTPNVWETLHGMRKPGQNYSELLHEMILVYDLEAAAAEPGAQVTQRGD
jgi:hypothetical protein